MEIQKIDEFDNIISRKECYKLMDIIQKELITQVRYDIQNKILKIIKTCCEEFQYIFDIILWDKYKIILITELLSRFDNLYICRKLESGITNILINQNMDITNYFNIIGFTIKFY